MKKILLFILFISSSETVFSQKVENMRRVEVDGFFTNPLVSPDGTKVLLTGHHLKGVYILNLVTNETIQVTDRDGSGYGYSWDLNNDVVYFKQKEEKEFLYQAKSYAYTLSSKQLIARPDLEANALVAYHGQTSSDKSNIVVSTNLTTLKIEAQDLVSNRKWIVTNDEGQFYNALLSPDGTKVAVHKGADLYIYPIEGATSGKKIGVGLATSWTKDGKNLIGFIDESEDGHTVSNSDLLWFDVEKGSVKKITSTEVFLEMYPTFINENKILFAEDKSGALYIANLKM
ncbi:Hypothetical protein precursor [Flavobacterium indicum GPTSA100-9 = DSM 17447]|uniref:Uncharacterized protein n=1 Tax=Flavobacterium indicum (strain DSM 17447 / CIP 109464 / GPTSA100-9) TaxID=1094466 RepID=H8XVD1_FLAIG|nr:hypothetical protein [Flavobacterium indicum]CCG53101.1 Hypothetical protein precursor [Flavobacterium indicum GPTSA100-9 = DSM 17447]